MKDFISYTEALALKELGFTEECFGYWYVNYKNENNITYPQTKFLKWYTGKQILAPTFSQTFRWFREKHSLYHSINPLGYNMCLGMVGKLGNLLSCNTPDYGNYEEAELACLRKLIELVTDEKQK